MRSVTAFEPAAEADVHPGPVRADAPVAEENLVVARVPALGGVPAQGAAEPHHPAQAQPPALAGPPGGPDVDGRRRRDREPVAAEVERAVVPAADFELGVGLREGRAPRREDEEPGEQ